MLPLAPARLSTTTLCPRASLSGIATRRATKSSPPPAPDATITLTGLLGYDAVDCAVPCGDAVASAAASAPVSALCNILIRSPRLIVGDEWQLMKANPPYPTIFRYEP